ncbi:histidinol dehydrogenase, partial [Rhizobium ruizarguesonis]
IDYATVPMRVTPQEIDAAVEAVPSEVLGALKLAALRIESHHRRQLPKDYIYEDDMGVGLGSRWTAIEAVDAGDLG